MERITQQHYGEDDSALEHPDERVSRALRLLYEAGVAKDSHTGGTFVGHLAGTYNLLLEWGFPDRVALAGLCHSLYGTQQHHHATVSPNERAVLQIGIGSDAEALVHQYAILDRSRFYKALRRHRGSRPELFDMDGQRLDVDDQGLSDLAHLTAADLVDIGGRTGWKSRRVRRCRLMVPLLSEPAASAVLTVLAADNVDFHRSVLNRADASQVESFRLNDRVVVEAYWLRINDTQGPAASVFLDEEEWMRIDCLAAEPHVHYCFGIKSKGQARAWLSERAFPDLVERAEWELANNIDFSLHLAAAFGLPFVRIDPDSAAVVAKLAADHMRNLVNRETQSSDVGELTT